MNRDVASLFSYCGRLSWAAVLAAIGSCASATAAAAADDVVAKPIVLNDNGAWSWFEDERAIVDPTAGKLLVSSVADSAGSGGGSRDGDIDVATLDLGAGTVSRFVLNAGLEDDDHDSASLWIRPDGRYLAMYSRHGGDPLSRYRISTNPGDATAWTAEQTFNNGAGATYSNLHFLPGDAGGAGRLYNFTRTNNYDPNILISSDLGATWSYGGKLLTEGGGGDRPYVRYFSDGNRIHFITTERHPRDFDNSVYYGYVADGKLYNAADAVVDANLFDGAAVAPATLTPVMTTGTIVDGDAMRRMWTVDTAVDAGGAPVVVFQARANNNNLDHRFFYGRLSGGSWQVHPLGYAGSYLYSAESDYTGLVSIDPDDPSTVYLSSEVHPATKAQLIGADGQRHYELFKGVTTDSGATWTWSPITFNSTVDNLRPLVPQWDANNTALLWMRGDYFTYTNYDLDVVGLVNPSVPTPDLALAVDFGATGQAVQTGFAAFTRTADPPGTNQSQAFNSPHAATGSQITLTLGGNVQFADRGDDVAGPLGDVADDFAFVGDDLTVAFANLARGNYQLVLYAHDRNADQRTFDIEQNGVDLGTLNPESGVNPPIGIASSRVLFGATGADDVMLTLSGVGSGGDVVLNGLELYRVGDYAPPYDLNADGALDLSDYQKLIQGLHTDLSGLSAEQAFELGDLNGDFQTNFADFRLFKNAYMQWNGPAAFAQLSAAVPEPGGVALAVAATATAAALRTGGRRGNAAIWLAVLLATAAVAPARAAWTYVDANRATNTGPPSAFTPGVNNQADDNLWTERTGFSSGGNFFQSGDGNGENAPEITTTLGGLTPNAAYAVHVHFWDASGDVEDWSIRAGYSSGNLSLYANPGDAGDLGAVGATLASTLNYAGAPPLFTEGNRTMFAALLGYASANASGDLTVYIDDLPSQIGVNNRTWYDGLSYELVQRPTLQANTTTGFMRIVNGTSVSIEMDYYEIRSSDGPAGSLYEPGWDSLDSQESDPFGAGWEEANGVDARLLSEGRLTSAQTLAPGESLPLGNAFSIGSDPNLAFFYSAPGEDLQSGVVAYVEGLVGDYDDDGSVLGRDFLRWQRGALSDPVDPGHLAQWEANYGSSIPQPRATAVPEPGAMSLGAGLFACAPLLARRRMVRRRATAVC